MEQAVIEQVRELKQEGKTQIQISKEIGVPEGTVGAIIAFSKRGLKSCVELQRHYATKRINPNTKKPFKSLPKYHAFLIRQKVNPETGKCFESPQEYKDYNARQRDNPKTGEKFKSLGELKDYRARQRDNPKTGEKFKSLGELKDYNARQRMNPETGEKFKSFAELGDYRARQRFNRNMVPLPEDLRKSEDRPYTPTDELNIQELSTKLCEIIDELPKIERDIIYQRFFSNSTLEGLATKHKSIKERIRQLETKALKKLYYGAKQAGLEHYIQQQ